MFGLHPRGTGRRRLGLRGSGIAAAAAVAILSGSGSAFADVASASVAQLVTPVIEIESDGKHYTKPAIALAPVSASVKVHLDALVSGRIKSFKTWLQFRTETSDWAKYPQHAYSESFPLGQRPKTYSRNVFVSVPYGSHANQLAAYCNFQANQLRQGGMTNDVLFSLDRPIEVAVHAGLEADMSGVDASGSVGGTGTDWSVFKKMTVVCKASDPQRVPGPPPVANDPTRDKPDVLQADLAIIENDSLRGACSVHLSGVIRTSAPDTEVKFRYRSVDGRESDLKTVTSDHTAMAMFSHEYPLSSGGVKSGKVRIVGASSSFASDWQDYEVDCGSPAQGFASKESTPPELTLSFRITKEEIIEGFICPTEILTDGHIATEEALSGQARHEVWLGPKTLTASATKDINMEAGGRLSYGFFAPVDWHSFGFSHDVMPQRHLDLEFRVYREGVMLAETKKAVFVSCRNAQGGGGQWSAGTETPETRPGGAAIGRLAKQQAQTFAIQAPRGLVRQGEIRLSGGAANAKYALKFLRKNGGGYVAVNTAQLPKQMTGVAASFPLQALSGGRDWRLEVCPLGATPTGCEITDFRLTRIGGAAAVAPSPQSPDQPQGTVFILPGVTN